MFKVVFNDVEKRYIKKLKELKPKYTHSLYEADLLLTELGNMLDDTTTLTIVVTDVENEVDYNFEDKSISNTTSSLLDLLEDDIISSGHEEAHKLINDLQKQYQEEASENEEASTNSSRTERKKKSIFGKLMKGKENAVEESIQNDFQEIEEEEINTGSVLDDFEGIDNEEFLEENSEDMLEEEELEVESFENENIDEEFLNDEEIHIANEFEKDEDDLLNDSQPPDLIEELDDDFEDFKVDTKKGLVATSKSSSVEFPTYNEFLNLSTLDPYIERYTEKFNQNKLIEYLGINYQSQDELEQKKLTYAIEQLNHTNFILIKDYFIDKVDELKGNIQNHLKETYDDALNYDYTSAAKELTSENVEAILKEKEQSFNEFESNQVEEFEIKLQQFEQKQEFELNELKKKHEHEKTVFVDKYKDNLNYRLEVFKDNAQKEIDALKVKVNDDKEYELKKRSLNELIETKRVTVSEFEDDLSGVVDEVWDKATSNLKTIRNDIENNILSWKKEIEQKKRKEAEEREEKRKDEQMRLEKERLALQREQFELNKRSVKVSENDTDGKLGNELYSKLQELEDKLSAYDRKINQENNVEQEVLAAAEPSTQKKKSVNRKSLLAIVFGGSLLITTVVYTAGQTDNAAIVLGNEDRKVEEATSQVQSLEVEPTKPLVEEDTEEDTLEKLISNKDYAKAMNLFKDDQDNLETIEEALFNDRDLITLSSFNKLHNTKYGKLDEEILSGNGKAALKIYNKMSEEDKQELSNERRTQLALLLYQIEETKVANKLMSKEK